MRKKTKRISSKIESANSVSAEISAHHNENLLNKGDVMLFNWR